MLDGEALSTAQNRVKKVQLGEESPLLWEAGEALSTTQNRVKKVQLGEESPLLWEAGEALSTTQNRVKKVHYCGRLVKHCPLPRTG